MRTLLPALSIANTATRVSGIGWAEWNQVGAALGALNRGETSDAGYVALLVRAPLSINVSVSGNIVMRPVARATRFVFAWLPTSTIMPWPVASEMCKRL